MSNRAPDGKIPKTYSRDLIARAIEMRSEGQPWKVIAAGLHKNQYDLCRYVKLAEREGFEGWRI